MAARISDEQIFDATISSVREQGIRGATTREIARVAGVNEVTLFRRFGDKSQLIRAAVHHSIARRGAGAFEATDDVRADIAAVVEFYAASLDASEGIALVLLTEVSRHPDLADLLTEPIAVLTRVAALIRHHQDRGALLVEPVGDAVAALTGPLLSSSLARAISANDATDDGFAERLVDSFLRGHGASRAATGTGDDH